MLILQESTDAQTISFLPTIEVTDDFTGSFQFTDTASKEVNTVTGTISREQYYAQTTLAFPFIEEDRKYELIVTRNGTEIFRSLVRSTNQNIEEYSANDGEYTIYNNAPRAINRYQVYEP